jgi:hypothetical protein
MKSNKKVKKEIERPVRDYESKSKAVFVTGAILLGTMIGVGVYNLIQELF